MSDPATYTLAAPPGMPTGNDKRQWEPTPYPTEPPPSMPSGNKLVKDDYEPAPYPIEPLPGYDSGNKVKRQYPEPYPIESPPGYDPGNKVKRQDPQPYPIEPPPGYGSGNRLLERGWEPSPYPTQAPLPREDGNKLKRSPQTVSSGTVTITPSATATATQTTTSTTWWPYIQLGGSSGSGPGWYFPKETVAAADYKTLCPGGNCLTDCQNMERVFQAFPDGTNQDKPNYGKAHSNGSLPDLTLFGICSNLGIVSQLAQTEYPNTTFASYFPTVNAQSALHNVSNEISLCFVDTCQYTRDPTQCVNYCSFNTLQSDNTTISMKTGVFPCMWQLCRNTCGLPFANQDVYGVGVLASYITQAILVLILAVCLIFFASWRYFKQSDTSKYRIPKRMKDSLELFLATECYFGISAAIASYLMRPATVDPLNGYALLSVSITGFVPPVFTLMLIHGHGVKSWYTTLLTFASWMFSTVLFFMLVKNLAHAANNPRAIDQGLNSLFSVDSCGRSSAMSLCQQMFDTDPLVYLSWFYNYWSIPSIKTVPILWVLSTVVLLCLICVQGYDHLRKNTENKNVDSEVAQSRRRRKLSATWSLGSLYIGSILFGLALGYQACMVLSFTRMNVIDWHGWTFGQVVAVLFWAPALVNCFRSYILEPKIETSDPNTYNQRYAYKDEPKKDLGYSTEQLSPDSLNSPMFFSTSDPSLFRQNSDLTEQSTRVPTDMLFGNFGRGRRERREGSMNGNADESKRDSVVR